LVVDVLLLSYHVTRTCVSAHALWTRTGERAPAVVVATTNSEMTTGACIGCMIKYSIYFTCQSNDTNYYICTDYSDIITRMLLHGARYIVRMEITHKYKHIYNHVFIFLSVFSVLHTFLTSISRCSLCRCFQVCLQVLSLWVAVMVVHQSGPPMTSLCPITSKHRRGRHLLGRITRPPTCNKQRAARTTGSRNRSRYNIF